MLAKIFVIKLMAVFNCPWCNRTVYYWYSESLEKVSNLTFDLRTAYIVSYRVDQMIKVMGKIIAVHAK